MEDFDLPLTAQTVPAITISSEAKEGMSPEKGAGY
jgi:hypothetical protein